MIKENPTVSVMMNCLNADSFLKNAIDSVYSQSFDDWEIIFWDNASTDKSLKIAQSYDHKTRIFSSEETVNLGKARSEAALKAKGKYLAFLDCDDVWLDKHLEILLKKFNEDEDIGLIYGRSKIINEDNSTVGFYPHIDAELPSGNIFKELCKQNFIPFVSAMADKKKFFEAGGFPSDFKHSTDYYLFLNMAQVCRVKAIDSIQSCYRIHQTNLTNSSKSLAAKESIKVVESFLPNNHAEIGLRNQRLNLAIAYFKEGKLVRSLSVILKNRLFFLILKRIIHFLLRNVK